MANAKPIEQAKPTNHRDQSDLSIDDHENPELAEEDFARGRPFKRSFPTRTNP
ncbi:hypothetical protein [Rhodopila sp.]|uniref:hypothetical protein n=1 Tax=Rhodopila sp. TaxID=2480087 RepID=UPI003D0D77EE